MSPVGMISTYIIKHILNKTVTETLILAEMNDFMHFHNIKYERLF